MKNYQPVYRTLSFLSKVMEKIVVNIIIKFIDENNLSEPLQLAYRAAHSTETVSLKLKDDIMTSFHHRQSVFLVLLDFSGPFDIL